jgi:transposase
VLDQIDVLTAKIERLTLRIEELIAAIPASQPPGTGSRTSDGGGGEGGDPATAPLPALDRLDEVPGIGRRGAQIILAEIGLDMTRFHRKGSPSWWCRRILMVGV